MIYQGQNVRCVLYHWYYISYCDETLQIVITTTCNKVYKPNKAFFIIFGRQNRIRYISIQFKHEMNEIRL